MKLGKALRLVLSRWDITPYRLAKASGVGQATIGKLISGALESSTWDVVERLENGFEELDLVAKVTFHQLLMLPEDRLPSFKIAPLPHLEEIERPENITKFIAAAEKVGLIPQGTAQEFLEKRAIPPELLIGGVMQQMRAEESAQDA